MEKLKETVPVDIVINKEDTVLLYIKSSAGGFVKDLKILGIEIGTVTVENNTLKISHKKGNGYYYPDEIYVKVIGSMEYKDATKQELNAESSTKFLYIDDSPKGKKLRKLTGQIKQLYQLNSTTSEEFWKQYIK